MKTPFESLLPALCTAFATALLLASAAPAADLSVRVFDRVPDVRNLDTTDTLKWYADESIDYTVRPRRGKEAVAIPGDAVATWIIADPATGTNYLSAVAASQTSNSVTFHLPLGGAALPEGVDEWVSFVSLLQGTNFLGVIDRCRAECLWSPYTSAAALTPTNPLPELLQKFATTGYVAAAIAAWGDTLYAECAGGYRWPDYFKVTGIETGVLPGTITNTATETATAYNVAVDTVASAKLKGWKIEEEVVRQSDWTNEVMWEVVSASGSFPSGVDKTGNPFPGLPLRPLDFVVDGDVVHFAEGVEIDWCDFAAVRGTLGEYTVELELDFDASKQATTSTVYRFAGPAADSLLAATWETVLGTASNGVAQDKTVHLRTWDGYGSGTSHVEAGWNEDFWAAGLGDFSCISYHTDTRPGYAGGVYRPLTLVTHRHAICANHWKPLVGSNVYWVTRSGDIATNTVTAYKTIRGDLAVARLDYAFDTNDIAPAKLLGSGWHSYLYGSTNYPSGLLGVPVIGFDCAERGYVMAWMPTALRRGRAEGVTDDASFNLGGGESSWPFYRAAPVGGDSGSPVFWPIDGTNTVLLGCWHTTAGGPIPSVSEVEAAIADWGDDERTQEYDLQSGGWTNPDTPPAPH